MAGSKAAQRSTNGVARLATRGLATAGVPYDDPLSRVFELDEKTSSVGAWFGFTSGGTLLLAALMTFASVFTWYRATHARHEAEPAPQEIEIVREEPPPPVEQKAEPAPEPAPAPPPHVSPHEAPPPPPSPAQASKVLTQAPDPNEPVDLTGNTIVTGNADTYAGGSTASNGTSTTAVRGLAAPTGVPGGTGPVTAAPPAPPSGPDRSRKPALPPGGEWNAPFPPEADTAQIDDARVTLQIDVRADGTAAAVHVLQDPGNGFGREARRHALGRHFLPGLDHDGNPIAGTTAPFVVHFQR